MPVLQMISQFKLCYKDSVSCNGACHRCKEFLNIFVTATWDFELSALSMRHIRTRYHHLRKMSWGWWTCKPNTWSHNQIMAVYNRKELLHISRLYIESNSLYHHHVPQYGVVMSINVHQGPLLLTWFTFNPRMDMQSHAQYTVEVWEWSNL